MSDPYVENTVTEVLAHPDVQSLDVSGLWLSGSRAYGTARPDSDVDVRGMFVRPAREFFRLETKPLTSVALDLHDAVFYELDHFARMACNGNAQAVEMLWAPSLFPDDDPRGVVGRTLVEHRHLFLSRRVFKSFGGFADGQLRKAKDGTGGSRGQGHYRREKFLLHTLRLYVQGVELLREGHLTLPLADPGWLREHAAAGLDHVVEVAADLNDQLRDAYENTSLPEHPAVNDLEDLLWSLRANA